MKHSEEVNNLTELLILRSSQLESTHRRCQEEIKRADKAEGHLKQTTKNIKGLVKNKYMLGDVIKVAYDKVHGLQFYIQLLEGKRDRRH